MENLIDYSRQQAMQNELRTNVLINQMVIGCGGIGFWLGLMLAMYGYNRIILFDGDVIDRSNLARLPVPPTWVGINKAVALRRLILFLRPDCEVKIYQFKVNESTKELFQAKLDNLGSTHVYDTTDNAIDQNMIYKMVSVNDFKYNKLGYEGFKVGSYPTYQVWTTAGYTTGYRTTSANVFSSCLAALFGFFTSKLSQEDIEFDIKEFITKQGR